MAWMPRLVFILFALGAVDCLNIYVNTPEDTNTAGDDTSGTGTAEKPYATLEKVFATITDPTTPLKIVLGAGEFLPAAPIDITKRASLEIVGKGNAACYVTALGPGSVIDWMALSMESYNTPLTCDPLSTYISGGQTASYNGHRIFFTDPSLADKDVNLGFTMSNVVLRRGHAHYPDHYGGCIRLYGHKINLAFEDVTFQDCHAAGPRPGFGYGGVEDGQNGGEAGALYIMGSDVVATLTTCKFYSCMAGAQPNGLGQPRGGAMVFGHTSWMLVRGGWAAVGNSANGDATLTLNNCEAKYNWAGVFSGSSYGGFLYTPNMESPYKVDVVFNGGLYAYNAAFMGSLVKARGMSAGTLTVADAQIIGNGWKNAPNSLISSEGTVSYDMNVVNPQCPCTHPLKELCGWPFGALVVDIQLVANGPYVPGCAWTQIHVMRNTFIQNAALSGGGVYVAAALLTKIEGNTFKQNYAKMGGAIMANAKLPILASMTGYTWAVGFGVPNAVKDNTFEQNYATSAGGGMKSLDKFLTFFSNNIWKGNVACFEYSAVTGMNDDCPRTTACTGLAAALDIASFPIAQAYNDMPTSKTWFFQGMTNDTFESNRVNGVLGVGGAIRFTGLCNLKIKDSTFIKNRATLGAAVASPPSGGVTFTDCTFRENYTPIEHVKIAMGGVAWQFQVVRPMLWTRCLFEGNSAGRFGGALRMEAKALTVFTDCNFTNNYANSSGGVLYVTQSAAATEISGCRFEGNRVYGAGLALDGGGVMSLEPGAKVVDTGSYYFNNSADKCSGGSFFLQQESSLSVSDTVLEKNFVNSLPGGGAVFMDSGSEITLTRVNMSNNIAGQSLALAPDDPSLPSPCIEPEAPAKIGGSGAHIYAKWRRPAPACGAAPGAEPAVLGTKIRIEDSDIENGESVAGGIYCDQCDLTIVDSRMTANTATQFGGVAYISKGTDTKFRMTNTSCTGNSAEIGGCLYFENRTLTTTKGHSIVDSGWQQTVAFPQCSFSGNKATGYGADYASDINEMVPIYQVTWRANQSVEECNAETGECLSISYPPGTVAPYDEKAKPVYIKTDPTQTGDVMSLLNVQSNTSFTVGFRPGVAFNLYVQLRDYFTQIANSDLTGSGVVMQLVPDMTRQPGMKAASVSSSGLTNVSKVFVGGSGEEGFNSYNWQVDSSWFRLTEGVVGKEVFSFNMQSNATECLQGEKTIYDQDPGFCNISVQTLLCLPFTVRVAVLIGLAEARVPSEDYLAQKVIKRCVWCKPGSYAVDTPIETCKDCPKKGADCDGGGRFIKPKGNFWRNYAKDHIYKCRFKDSCLGSPKVNADVVPTVLIIPVTKLLFECCCAMQPCKEGYTGPLCAVCAEGWASTGAFCHNCHDGIVITRNFIMFLIVIALLLSVISSYVYKLMFADPDAPKVSSTKMLKILMKKKKTIARLIAISDQVKILIAYFQVVICIIMGGSAPFPMSLGQLMNSFEIVNVDIMTMLKGMCAVDVSYYSIWIYNFSLPILVSSLLILHAFLTRPDPEDDSFEARTHWSFCYKIVLMLLFTVYPNCSRIMLGFFNCHAIQWDDDTVKHFLKTDYSLECFEGDWMYYLPWAIVGVLLYPIGIPVLFYNLLAPFNRNRELNNGLQTMQTPEVADRYDFLFCRFVPEYWWYETSECIRKMVVGILIPSFVMPGTATNTLVMLMVNLIYVCMMLMFWPYKSYDDNCLFTIQLIAIEFTLFGTLMINGNVDGQDEYADGITTGVLLGTTVILIILYIIMLLRFQLPFICIHGFPLFGLQIITDSKLNCFRETMLPGGRKKVVECTWFEEGGCLHGDPKETTPMLTAEAQEVTDKKEEDTWESGISGVGLEANPVYNDSSKQNPEEDEMNEDELDELIETYFHRYDLDESGTINSNEELQQLTTNLAFKLKLGLTGNEIDETVGSVGDLNDENGMTLEVFTLWFKEHFLDFDTSDIDDGTGVVGTVNTVNMSQAEHAEWAEGVAVSTERKEGINADSDY